MSIGVGFLGGGPVTQAIHLPVLAGMAGQFHVARVMDVNPSVADAVARRCGAKASTTADAIYGDPDVEIVAICSPNDFHAEQVIAACRAGKKAILCEKPLAVSNDEADGIASVAGETGTPILVGTMHAFDPAYRAAADAWRQTGDTARLIESSILLPSNDVFIDQATNKVAVEAVPRRAGGTDDSVALQQRMFRMAMLGLAIHNIPLIRDYFAASGTLKEARYVAPFGYRAVMTNGEQGLSLQALMPGKWPAKWTLRIIGDHNELMVDFPPSYVLAGSAQARLKGANGMTVFSDPRNGYEALWSHLRDIVRDGVLPMVPLKTATADLRFALDLADQADVLLK